MTLILASLDLKNVIIKMMKVQNGTVRFQVSFAVKVP